MNPRKIWLIARREFTYNFRRRSFLFTAFVLPLISIAGIGIVMSLLTSVLEDTSAFKNIGIIDKAGVFTDSTGKVMVNPPAPFRLIPTEIQADANLKSSAIDGYYVLPPDFLRTGRIDAYNRQTLALTQGLQDKLDEAIKQALATRLGDPTVVARLQDPLKNLSIYRLGNPQKLEESALISTFLVPMLFGLLVFMTILVTSQFLMSGMVEEKENRIMELLVTSSRPGELLWGKLLGLGALGLSQIIIWGVFGLIIGSTRGISLGQVLANLQITPGFLILLVCYFILGYLLFGAVMAGIGASVNAEQEGRQISGMLSMVGIIPFWLIFTYITDPNGPIPTILSLFPFTAPVGMILRLSWTTVPPLHIVLSFVIMALSVFVVMWIAGRVFRLGMLSYGKRIGLRDIIRAFREGRQTIVTTSHPKESAV